MQLSVRQAKENRLHLALERIKRRCKRDYYAFFLYFWDTIIPDEYIDNWHIEYLCKELQEVGEWVINREAKKYDLIINVSPGESKSTIATVLFPVWLWVNAPWARIITGSYSGALSMEHAGLSRDCIRHEKFKHLFGDAVEIRGDIDAKGLYKNTESGFRRSVSTGSAVTGSHGHILIIDDPINPKQTASEYQLTVANNWMTKTLSTRKVDKKKTPTILVMQRLHQDDPTGHLLAKNESGGKIRHICLPAEDSYPVIPKTIKKHYQGGYMNPSRTGKEVLDEARGTMGTYEYDGQFGQQPVKPGGGKIKLDWFEYCHEKEVPGNITLDLWVDGAYTEKTKNDPSGFMVAGYHERSNRLYIVHAHSKHMELPEALKFIKEYTSLHRVSRRGRVRIEPKASGKSIGQMINSDSKMPVSAVEIKSHLVSEGKEARLQAAAPKIEAGRVVLVRGAWNDAFTAQITQFPVASHDEYVDLIGYACDHYFKRRKSGVRSANR